MTAQISCDLLVAANDLGAGKHVTLGMVVAVVILVAPLGLAEFHVSPGLVGLLAAGEPLGALLGGALIAAGVPPARFAGAP